MGSAFAWGDHGSTWIDEGTPQRAVVEVLNAVYEADFLGFSYGFRPGRSPHRALDALATAITRKRVNWVLDADIRGFFETIDHGWLWRFLEHGVADKRVLRPIQKWLNAGVIEDGARTFSEQGTPQAATISPLLANVYLHYVFDLWANQWRSRHARGDVILVRYADDFVVGFEHRDDAERFLAALRDRFAQYALELQPEKTRLIEFGRFAAQDGVPGNSRAIQTFRWQVVWHWHRALRRRSQRTRLTWERMDRLAKRWLPPARVTHPWPQARFAATTQGRSPVR